MIKHTVTLPDGEKIKVSAPEDADDEEIFAFALHSIILRETKLRKDQDAVIQSLVAGLEGATSRLDDAEKKVKALEGLAANKPQPQRQAPAPVVNVTPELKVVTDPGIAAAIAESGKTADNTARLMLQALDKVGKQGPAAKPVPYVFEIEHDMDQRSPRFGRMKRVIATPA